MTKISTDGTHTVNKEIAQELLNTLNHTGNRHIKPLLLKKYIGDMVSGNWHNNYDPIRISETNELLDGQHRLTAVVESDTVQEIYFIFNIPDEVAEGVMMFEVIDQATRKPYEILEIVHKDLLHPAEVTKLMSKVEAFNDQKIVSKPNGYTITNKSVLAFSEAHQPLHLLDEAVIRGKNLSLRGDSIIDKNDFALYTLTIGQCNKGNTFLEILAGMSITLDIVYTGTGQEVAPTDPIANLVRTLTSMKQQGKTNKIANKLVNRYLQVFKAYEKFIQEEQVAEGYKYTGDRLTYPLDYEYYAKGL